MSTNLTIREQLLEKFRSRRRRRTFAEEDVGTTIAAQVFALRNKHDNMSQEKLATEAEMSQARISVIENPNYRRLNIRTLQRIAKAFDVALVVRFVSFGELLDWTVTGTQKTLAPLSFDEEFPDAAITAVTVKPKNNVVSIASALKGGLEINPSPQEEKASDFSAGNDARISASNFVVQTQPDAPTSKGSAALQTKVAQAN